VATISLPALWPAFIVASLALVVLPWTPSGTDIAFAQGNSGGNGGGNGGGNSSNGGGNSGNGGSHENNGNSGNNGNNGNAGNGRDNNSAGGRNQGAAGNRDAASGRNNGRAGAGTQRSITHSNGMTETIRNGRYEMRDAQKRVIVNRQATIIDYLRLRR